MLKDYIDIIHTLYAMESSDDEEFRIDKDVRDSAFKVVDKLVKDEIDTPKIMRHGPHSVVFFWEEGDITSYITITPGKISFLRTDTKGVFERSTEVI